MSWLLTAFLLKFWVFSVMENPVIFQFIYFHIDRRVWIKQKLFKMLYCTKEVGIKGCISFGHVLRDPFATICLGLGGIKL